MQTGCLVKPYVKQTNEVDVDGLPLESFINDNQDGKYNKNICSKTKKRAKARIIQSVWFNKESEPEKHYKFKIKLGLNQGSALSAFLFILVLDTLADCIRMDIPWELIFADDIALVGKMEKEPQESSSSNLYLTTVKSSVY